MRNGGNPVIAMIDRGSRARRALAAGLLLLVLGAAPQTSGQAPDAKAGDFPALPPGTPHGYLPPETLPDSLALLPPPPMTGSPAFARDEAASAAGNALRANATRFAQAASDADLRFPHAAGTFSCATNLAIDKDRMPHLYALLGRTLIDVGFSTYRAKNRYQRVRPFVLHQDHSCSPADEKFLSTDGSYPSGHSAAGWGWALLLTELVPDRADAILARGRDFGASRIVCNVHWQSDVDAGRVIAAATIARLHADPQFRADLEAARAEIAQARAAGSKPAQDCYAETAALASEP